MADTFLDFIDRNEKTIPVVSVENENDIAIIGVAVKLPLADTMDEFWTNLISGRDCVRKIKGSRLRDIEDYLRYTNASNFQLEEAAYLERIDYFAYDFFGISPKEAQLMDPCQRLYLEAIWNVFEDAGYPKSKIQCQNIGIYLGHTGETEYRTMVEKIEPENMDIATVGNLVPVISGRISHMLDLKGPNVVINTLCSSSLVAVHYACEAILNGDCKMAIASGIQLHINPIRKARMGIESSNNRSKTFDNSADGTGCGEGIGCVLLKPLQKALLDHDNIYAVIKGSGMNHDGHAIGISAPNPEAQASLLDTVWKKANINPEDIGYIEAHGTGTALGDTVEIDGLTRAFEKHTDRKQFCAIGAVKSNIGHLDGASGITGLIKTVLMLKNKKIPPSIHFAVPNRKISFLSSPVFVNNYLQHWKKNEHGTRIGGVSSFGLSGTNCHVVLEEAPKRKIVLEESTDFILPISAKDKVDLQAFINKYITFLSNQSEKALGDICYTSALGKEHYEQRVAVVGSSISELIEKLMRKKVELEKNNQRCYVNADIHKVYENLRKENSDRRSLLECICLFYENGEDISWNIVQGSQHNKVSLPTYPFKNIRCWLSIPRTDSEPVSRYTMEWKEQKADLILERNAVNTVLVFKHKEEKTEQLLQYASEIAKKTIVVDFDNEYKIFLETLELSEIDVIIYSAAHVSNEESLNKELERLFFLHKYFFEKIHKNVKLRIITECADKVTKEDSFIQPAQRAIVGFAKAIACEKMNLDVKCLDISDEFKKEDIEQFINERNEFFTALRNGNRYINALTGEINVAEDRKISIREHGIYVITGGLGGFGLDIVQYLSNYKQVTVILLGRSDFDSCGRRTKDIKKKIRKIQEKGTAVEYIKADVTDQKKMKETLEVVYKKYGMIHGLFHCAGIGSGKRGKLLCDDDYEDFKAVLEPKVHGTYILFDILKDKNVDFMVLMTSPITITGGVQSGSYIVANSFMDAFGKQNNSNMYIGAISWAPRMETVLEAEAVFHYGRQLFFPLSKEEIFYCLDTFFESPLPYCIVGNINNKSEILDVSENLLFSVAKNVQRKTEGKDNKKQCNISMDKKVELTGRKDNSYSHIEQIIAAAYGTIFGYEKIGVTDSFYEIGGDSIIAMRLVNYLNEKEKLGLKLSEFVSYPSVELLAGYLASKQLEDHKDEVIKRVQRKKYYQATETQKEIYISCKANGETISYNMPAVFQLTGEFCVDRFKEALMNLCKRHELLRASFFIKDEEVCYQVNNPDIDFQYYDGENVDVKGYMKSFVKPFELGRHPLWKVEVIKENSNKYNLLFDMHHIIADDRAMEILISDLFLFYQGKGIQELQYQYCDYAKWFEDNLTSECMKKQKRYWKDVLGEKMMPLNLPTSFPRLRKRSYQGAVVETVLSSKLSKALRTYSKIQEMSVFGIMVSAFSVILSKYSRQEDIVIGVPVSLRTRAEFDDIFGPLLNTVVIRTKPYNYLTINDFLDKMKDDIQNLYSNKEYPIHNLMIELGEQRKWGRNSFYDVLFDYHGKSQETLAVSNDLNLESVPFSGEISKLDMTMNVSEVEDTFKVWVEYSTDLFEENWIREFMDNYKMILDYFVTDKDVMLEDMKLNLKHGTSKDAEIFEELNDEVSFNF